MRFRGVDWKFIIICVGVAVALLIGYDLTLDAMDDNATLSRDFNSSKGIK